RIIRQPVPIPGEQEKTLPPAGALDLGNSVNICIDFSNSGGTLNRSINVGTHAVSVGISAASEAGNTVSITTAQAHNLTVGQTVVISGVGVAGYNGTFTIDSVPSATTFTYTNSTAGLAGSSGGAASIEVCDLLFSPLGALIGTDTTNALVILWVRDGMKD